MSDGVVDGETVVNGGARIVKEVASVIILNEEGIE